MMRVIFAPDYLILCARCLSRATAPSTPSASSRAEAGSKKYPKGPPPLEPAELDLSHAGEGEWEGGMPELRDKIMTGGVVDIAELELFTRKLHALHAVRVVGSPKGGD